MGEHDNGYRNLFSHPQMVRDLLLGFVPHDWVTELDMATLERCSGSYVTDDLRSRYSDIVWRVLWQPERVYVYLLLEFQSTVDPFMAVRTLAYSSLLYQDLIRAGDVTIRSGLPSMLPIVLYNGTPRWHAAARTQYLAAPGPRALNPFLPRQRYLSLDAGAYREEDLEPMTNLVAALFRLENSRAEADLQAVVALLVDWLKAPQHESLRRSFAEWLARYLRRAGILGRNAPTLRDLQEIHSMLEERVAEWKKAHMQQGLREGLEKGLEQGLEQGIEQGLERGRLEGEAGLLLSLMTYRFGEIPETVQTRLASATHAELNHWAERILDATTLDDVFR